jgi:branched-chain amino acid transport system substrate-binding protein
MRPSQSAGAIEIIQGGHQNKADIASALARKWFADEGVDIIVTAAGIAVALAVADIAKLANKTLLVTGALSSRLTGDAGTPNSAIEDGDTSPNGGGTK